MKTCSIEGCNEKHTAKGYCKSHYRRYKKYGDPLAAPKRREYPKGVKRKSNIPYEENHRVIDGIENKLCSVCENWLPMNKEYFYKNKSNNIDGFNPYCKECTKKRSAKWIKENPERYKEIKKTTEEKPRSKMLKRKRNEKVRKAGKVKLWQLNNKEKLTQYGKDRRKRKTHEISDAEWLACKEYFNNSCAYCGLHIDNHYIIYAGNPKKTDLHKEHVDDKGSNKLDNCIPSCQRCNSSKYTFELHEWYNENSPNFSQNRLDKIHKWLDEDYKLYIEIN